MKKIIFAFLLAVLTAVLLCVPITGMYLFPMEYLQ